MTAANQFTNRVPIARRRQLQKQAGALLDAEEKAKEDILVAIHEMKEENLSNAAVAGIFGTSPSGIPGKARQGAKILAERRDRKKGNG